jgi:hypothetical protein
VEKKKVTIEAVGKKENSKHTNNNRKICVRALARLWFLCFVVQLLLSQEQDDYSSVADQ